MDALKYLSRVESNARTYANSFPRMFTTANGIYIHDSSGERYLDCLSNAGVFALGHNHPEVQEALQKFLGSNQVQQALDLATPAKYAFVKELFSLLPEPLREHGKIQFCGPTGADAVEAALKLTKHHTGRTTVLAFRGGYHGMTAGALAAMGNLHPKMTQGLGGVHFLPYPYAFRCPFGTDGKNTEQLSIDYIHNLLADPESGVTKPAAVIVEVVQGEGGCIPASAYWMQQLRQLTQRFDVPLIVDEVQTGLGRTGHVWAIEHAGIIPDALVLSKAIGGGYPMSVVVYHERLDTWLPGMHAGTFRGNQIAMVAGRVTMQVVERDLLAQQAAKNGAILMDGLRQIARDFPFLGEIRGRGLMVGIEVVRTDTGKRPAPADGALAKMIKSQCFEQGLILETGGRYGAVLRLLPPLIISESEIGEVLNRFSSALTKVSGMRRLAEPAVVA